MLFQIISYIKFLLKSTNQHSIHSPFVYNLVTKCFYDTSKKKWYKKLNQFQNELLKVNTTIKIEDFGAGSKSFKNNERKISSIAKNAGISKKRAQLLGRLANYLNAKNVLEIGTSIGISAASLSLGNPNSNIITLEGCANTANIAKNSFEKFGITNIDVQIGNFDITLPKALKNKSFDLVFFDGNHQKEPTIKYFKLCLDHAHNNTVFIFDDIYWSIGMQETWHYIKQHPKVTISIDTFYWGLVFFRKEQEKQHFTIRI